MGVLFSMCRETFLLLRRDQVFLPIIVIMAFVAAFANLMSGWGTSEYKKILYDVGTAGVDIAGALVAIFWGTKLIADSKKEGYLELQLAAPVSRTKWVIGKFLGLAATLLLIFMTVVVVWQGFLLFNSIGWMEPKHVIIFAYSLLGWLVLASLAIFLASITSQLVAMFTTLSLWFMGLILANIAATLHPDTPEVLKEVVRRIALVWDLQRFNLAEYASSPNFIDGTELFYRAGYAIALCLLLVTSASILFSRKDIVG